MEAAMGNEQTPDRELLFFANALQRSPQPMAAGDADGRLLYFNHAFAELTGYTEEELRSTTWNEDLTPPEWRKHEADVLDELRRTGKPQVYEKEYIRKDGTRVPLEIRVHIVRNEDGSEFYYAFVSDVTTRKAAEKALRDSEAEARALAAELLTVLEVSPALTFVAHDPKCEHITCSRMTYQFLRLPPGTNTSKSVPESDQPRGFKPMRAGRQLTGEELPLQRAVATRQEVHDAEFSLGFENGEVRHVLGNAAPLFDTQGEVRGAVGTFIDITERKHAEDVLRQSEKLAIVARLAASMSHEINNPLEAVGNLLFLLKSSPPNQVPELVSMAEEELARIRNLVSATLNPHSTSATVLRPEELLDSVLGLYMSRFNSENIRVLRQYRGNETLIGYEGELRQMLTHVIGNAFDATRFGGVIVARVKPSTDWRNGRKGVRVTIADSGHGMSRETLRHIFEPFFSTKGDTAAGLGLWNADQVVRKHGGCIKVRSKQGARSGTSFSVFLPSDGTPAR